jgi:6-phosphogluconolactonase
VHVYPDPAEVARGAARSFVDYAWQSIAKDGQFMVALSGGNTPRQMFELLASDEFRGQVDWAKVHFFWSDERAVPPTNPESNYGMARRELLIRVPVPEGNVHRMEAEKPSIGRAAHEYEELLRKYLDLDDRGFPRFHLIYLGLGKDGHTASLFPGTRVIRQTSRWVSTPLVTKMNMRRMTLTLPVLDAALRIIFLVVGSEKAEILHAVLEGKSDPPYPAQLVQPRDLGLKLFLVDKAAAAMLTPAGSDKAVAQEKPAGATRGKHGRSM